MYMHVRTYNYTCVYILQLSHQNKEHYCTRQGYAMLDGTGWYSSSTHGHLTYYSWLKVQFLCHMMNDHKEHQWLFWMDTDTLIMNMQIRLGQLLVDVERDDVIVIAADAEGLNAGTFFIQNSEAGRAFCENWLSKRAKYRYEQQALSILYNEAVEENGDMCSVEELDLSHPSGIRACLNKTAPGFRVLRLCAMGSWSGLEWKCSHGYYFQGVYMYGDFIVHFAGNDKETKLRLMEKMSHDY